MRSCTNVAQHQIMIEKIGWIRSSVLAWISQIDEDITLTQFEAILRYISEKNNMGGANPKERAILSMINGSVNDLRWAFVRICYSPDFEKLKPGFLASLPDSLKPFEEYLKTHFWISGNKLDYPDFNLYDLLDTLKALEASCLDSFPKLKDYVTKFEALPQIAAYMKSSRFMKWPYNNRMASWGG
ncbi:hypothetical protein AHF37_09868, partial [Paragonimus kellicotti]